MNTYDILLKEGFADTRSRSLVEALDVLHHSVGQMDERNLHLLKEKHPEILKSVQFYGRSQPILNKFEL